MTEPVLQGTKLPEPEQIFAWIRNKKSLLVVTHERPDGDALGSIFGVSEWLRPLGIHCTPYVKEPVPERYRGFAPANLLIGGSVDLGRFDAVMCLDAANEKRVDLPNGLSLEQTRLPACNLDHHIDNSRYGELAWTDPAFASTTELLTAIIRTLGFSISPTTATLLLLGIVTDTGGFRFTNTTARTFAHAAWLMESGADHGRIMREVYFNDPFSLLRLHGRIFESVQFAFDGRLAYFVLTPGMLAEFQIEAKDTEDLIDVVRVIRGVDVVCRLQETTEGTRFSLRSRNEKVPILELAHRLGGGGHKLAAGALAKGINLRDGEQLLLTHAQTLFAKA